MKNEILKTLSAESPEIIDFFVKKLEIKLVSPEHELVKQGCDDAAENDLALYFVQKGDCSALVHNKIGLEVGNKKTRTLYPGDHFGEISLIYNCKRTATVVANNYCTLAKLPQKKYREAVLKYPNFAEELKQQIFEYDDEIKIFLNTYMGKIDYLQNAEREVL